MTTLVIYVVMAMAPWTTWQIAGPFKGATDAEARVLCEVARAEVQEHGQLFHTYRCVKIAEQSSPVTPPAPAK